MEKSNQDRKHDLVNNNHHPMQMTAGEHDRLSRTTLMGGDATNNKPTRANPIPPTMRSAPAQFKEATNSTNSAGNSNNSSILPKAFLQNAQQVLGKDVSSVNVHTNSKKAPDLGALAFTQGKDIHFAPGQFNPETKSGQELIGHELTHVAQQSEGRVNTTTQKKGVNVNNEDHLEKEADEKGLAIAEGKTYEKSSATALNTVQNKVIQRQNDQEELDKIAPQQSIYEFAAHHLVYKPEGSDLTPQEADALKNNGYSAKIKWYGASQGAKQGFQALLIHPTANSNKNPIVAIRGTLPDSTPEALWTFYSDMEGQSVGWNQIQLNRDLIKTIFNDAKGKVDLTGHSLGAAVAQQIAVYYAPNVANIATFQSPGIDQKAVDKFNNIPEGERPNVTHHIVTGDVVDKAGEASLPGPIFEHDYGKHLNVITLLTELGTYTNELLNNISKGQLTSHRLQVNAIKSVTSWNIFKNYSDIQKDLKTLEKHINNIKQSMGNISNTTTKALESFSDAHSSLAFMSEHYECLREDNGMAEVDYKDVKINRPATVKKYDSYPYQDQRKVAEPIRWILGKSLQTPLKAVIITIEVYQETSKLYSKISETAEREWLELGEKSNQKFIEAQKIVEQNWINLQRQFKSSK